MFILGRDQFRTLGKVEIPVEMRTTEDEAIELYIEVHMISKPIEMLVGMNTLKNWRGVLDTEDHEIGLKKSGEKKQIDKYIKAAFDGHFVVPLWGKDQKDFNKRLGNNTLFVEVRADKEGNLVEIRSIVEECKQRPDNFGVQIELK